MYLIKVNLLNRGDGSVLKLLWKRIQLYRLYKEYAYEIKYISDVRAKFFYKDRIKELEKEIKDLELEYFYNQSLFLYCPNCGEELISQYKGYEENGIIMTYECDKCHHISNWVNGIAPIPMVIKNEEDLKKYSELTFSEDDN